MKQVMKIGKGVEIRNGETHEITAYVGKCATSLCRLLEVDKVTIKAMGNRAVANSMKTIARAAKLLEREGKELVISAPAFVTEEIGESSFAVFTIDVCLK